MKMQDLITAVVKRFWAILALVVVSALVASLVAYIQSPVYKVEIVLAATPPKNPTTKLPDPTVGLAYTAAMPSIANACESLDVAESVSLRLKESGTEIPPEELVKKASAIPEANSNSLKITFTDGSPTRVAEIANAWGEVLQLKTLAPIGEIENPYYDPDFKEILLGGTMVFTNRAVPPEKPTQPKPLVYLGLGVFIGLVLGLSLAIGVEYFNPHFRTVEETEEMLGLPVLGIIPRERGVKPDTLLPRLDDISITLNSYAELRSSLLFSHRDESGVSVLVAPVMPFDAAPTTAVNLAASIPLTGRRALLVDADLKEGAATRLLLGESGRAGLTEALEEGREFPARIVPSGITGLDLLPAGATTVKSPDLLSLPLFEEGLRELEELYDVVVVYGPALLLSMDAAIVAARCRLSLLVIDADRCTRKMAREALAVFERMKIKPTGVVLVNVKVRGREKARLVAAARRASREGAGAKKGKKKALFHRREEAARRGPAAPSATGPTMVKTAPVPPPSPPQGEEEGPRAGEDLEADFRQLGEKGSPIPRPWLRALNSERKDVRASAERAVTAYYHAFLPRYGLGPENVREITLAIIRMMRREGEFSRMSEGEAQKYLQRMMAEAGARFSTPKEQSSPGEEREAGRPGESGSGGPDAEVRGVPKKRPHRGWARGKKEKATEPPEDEGKKAE